MDPNIYALVLDTLNRATSQDTNILKPAERKLQEWETEPGFYSVLLNIFSDHGINVNVRWLAVMCFKNGIDRYWRKNAPSAIADEEKEKLRMGLLTTNILSEPVTQIATQLAVLISKIARFDCPASWPNLVPDLLSALKAPQPLIQHRSLLTFHHIVKTMASKRLIGDRKTFKDLTETVFSYILGLWHENTELFLRHIQEGASTELITEHLEKALLCLRVLRKLTVFGIKKGQHSSDVVSFLNVVFDRAKTSLECRKLLKGRGIYPLELCEKFIIHLTKVALGVLDAHPILFIPLIRPALEFTIYYCFTEQGMNFIFERFTIQCLNIIKGILVCVEYKIPKIGDQTTDPEPYHAHSLKMSVLTEQTVCHMCGHLVGHYFLLTQDDLELWDSEPESFASDEAGESWKYSLRPCTEAVFLELFYYFREVFGPEIVRLLSSLPTEHTTDLQLILRKDAVYNAVGLVAFELYDDIDFDEWFTKVLSVELKIQDTNYRIIRRRICQLIGQWCGVRASSSLRPLLYSSLLACLGADHEDAAVKLAAADALRSVIDDFNFDPLQFQPFAPQAFSALYNLLVESEECDTKMRALHVLSFVLERNGAVCSGGHARSLLLYLPQLWTHAHKHNMLRAAILTALVDLVKALEDIDPGVRSWVVTIVGEATRLNEPQHVYLLEDALELWLATLESAKEHDTLLLQLSSNLPPILEQSSENLRTLLYIMQAYTLLCPEQFLIGEGGRCMSILDEMLSDMRTEGVLTVLKMAEVCISVHMPERNALLGYKVIWPILIRSVRGLLDTVELPMIYTLQLCLLSRVILTSPELFFQVVQEASAGVTELDANPDKVLGRMLDVWTESMNLVTQIERWKLMGLALAALLTTQNANVLCRFSAILLNITEVLNDVMKTDESGQYIDGLLATPVSRPASPLEGLGRAVWGGGARALVSEHDARRAALAAAHPAYNIHMPHALAHQLDKLREQIGLDGFQKLVDSCDKETLTQIKEYVKI